MTRHVLNIADLVTGGHTGVFKIIVETVISVKMVIMGISVMKLVLKTVMADVRKLVNVHARQGCMDQTVIQNAL